MSKYKPQYTVSIQFDRRLYTQDIAGSIAHARMLSIQGIISKTEAESIVQGLVSIENEIAIGKFPWREELEDIHMNIEKRLFEKIGDVAGKLHTARSRNDQVATDMRLFIKDAVNNILKSLQDLSRALIKLAEENVEVPMPGYTHLQRAQPVLFAHHMLAYFEMFKRDFQRFELVKLSADVLPLGSGALAGVPYNIDRKLVAEQLGFGKISANSMDAISDRDFLLEFQSSASICMMHLSRLSEELIIWSSSEFDFIRIGDPYTTGSSIMPQKRNPDFAEIARGKTGRVYGNLMGLFTLMKGLPLTYNRDLQEDKESSFDTFDTLLATLNIFTDMLASIEVNHENLREASSQNNILATDIADYLVLKGMPFRQAHGVVNRLSQYAVSENKNIGELPMSCYKKFSDLFENDVLDITVKSSIDARNVYGGTSSYQVNNSIEEAKSFLGESDE